MTNLRDLNDKKTGKKTGEGKGNAVFSMIDQLSKQGSSNGTSYPCYLGGHLESKKIRGPIRNFRRIRHSNSKGLVSQLCREEAKGSKSVLFEIEGKGRTHKEVAEINEKSCNNNGKP